MKTKKPSKKAKKPIGLEELADDTRELAHKSIDLLTGEEVLGLKNPIENKKYMALCKKVLNAQVMAYQLAFQGSSK